jgi:hypothetical protein
MKKILFFFLILFIPVIVWADSVSPHIIGYDAVVINKNGVTYDDGEDKHTIKYNTKLFVRNEYDGEASVCLNSNTNECFTVSIKNIAPVKKEVVPKDILKKDNDGTTVKNIDSKLFIINKKGEKLKKGPADIYGYYDVTVPYKQIVKVSHAIHFTGHGGGYSWFYVDDGKYQGWISNDEGIAVYYNDSLLMFEDVKLYNIDTKEVIDTIPVETVINGYYNAELVYVTYKDNFGYITSGETEKEYYRQSFGFKSKVGYILTAKSIEMTSKGKTLTAIPKGERIKILYGGFEEDEIVDAPNYSTGPICITKEKCYYYIEYNGVKGFIRDDDNIISLDVYDKIKTKSYDEDKAVYDVTYYLDPEGKLYENKMPIEDYSKLHETDDILIAGTKVTYYMSSYITDYSKDDETLYGSKGYTINLIKYGNNKIGWVIEEKYDDRAFKEEPKEIEEPKEDRNMTTIFICVGAALLISVIAIVTIILINKKKKNKKVINNIVDNNNIDNKNEG